MALRENIEEKKWSSKSKRHDYPKPWLLTTYSWRADQRHSGQQWGWSCNICNICNTFSRLGLPSTMVTTMRKTLLLGKKKPGANEGSPAVELWLVGLREIVVFCGFKAVRLRGIEVRTLWAANWRFEKYYSFSVSCLTCVAKIDQPRVLSQLSVLTSDYSLQNQRSPTSSRASGYWIKTNEKFVKAHLAMFLYPGWSSYPWEGGAKSEPG